MEREKAQVAKKMPLPTLVLRILEVVFDITLIGLAGVYCNGAGNCPLDFLTHYNVEGHIFVLIAVSIGILVSGAYLLLHFGALYNTKEHSTEISLLVGMIVLMGVSACVETFYASDFDWEHGKIWRDTLQPQWVAAAVIAWANMFVYALDACYLCIGGRVTVSQ